MLPTVKLTEKYSFQIKAFFELKKIYYDLSCEVRGVSKSDLNNIVARKNVLKQQIDKKA